MFEEYDLKAMPIHYSAADIEALYPSHADSDHRGDRHRFERRGSVWRPRAWKLRRNFYRTLLSLMIPITDPEWRYTPNRRTSLTGDHAT
jgi:hypothetical protein